MLLDRVCDPELSDMNTRIRGVSMCQHWIQYYWDNDFYEQDAMLDIMDSFVEGVEGLNLPSSDLKIVKKIKKTYEDRVCTYFVCRCTYFGYSLSIE